MSARIRPSSSSIVQESVEKCEVGHTYEKVFRRIAGQASATPRRSPTVSCRRNFPTSDDTGTAALSNDDRISRRWPARPAEPWSLTSLREKLIKIGAKVVNHGRYVTFQMAEVAVSRIMFRDILMLIAQLRAPPARA
jgi:hypothetical protein